MFKHYLETIEQKELDKISIEKPELGIRTPRKVPQRIISADEDIIKVKDFWSKDDHVLDIYKNPKISIIPKLSPRGVITNNGLYMTREFRIHHQIIMYLKENNHDFNSFAKYEMSALYDNSYKDFLTVHYDSNKNVFEFGESYTDMFKCLFNEVAPNRFETFSDGYLLESEKFLKDLDIDTSYSSNKKARTQKIVQDIRNNKNKVLPAINNLIEKLEFFSKVPFRRTFNTGDF